MTELDFFLPLSKIIPTELIPLDRIAPREDLTALFDRIPLLSYDEQRNEPGPGGRGEIRLGVLPEAVFEVPGLDGFSLVLGGAVAPLAITLEINEQSEWRVGLGGAVRIRFPRELLRPVIRQDGAWVDDPAREFAEIEIGATVLVDQNWNVAFDGPNEFSLGTTMIGESGVVVEGTVALDFSETSSLPETLAMGLGNNWRGAVLKPLTIYLPENLNVPVAPSSLTLTDFHIGGGGISGSVRGNWNPIVSGGSITGEGSGDLFGIPFGLRTFKLDLLQNAIIGAEARAVIALPYFDHTLDVELGFDVGGNISISVDAAALGSFSIAPGGVPVMDVTVERLAVEHAEGVLSVSIGGMITPKFGGLSWPTFGVERLYIDSDGNVRLDGGWLNLPDQYSLDFYGFQIDITKLGFGKTDDGGKWIGFSGALKLVDGLPAGASVEGLRVIWYDDRNDDRAPAITLEGVGVEFEVPDVLRFKGAVSYRELPGDVHRFDGDIRLELLALDLEIDGQLVIGSDEANGYTFFAIHLGVELPAGIPLWATGVALYGMAGLFAVQMEPKRQPDQKWYSIDGQNSWYHEGTPGVADLAKWHNAQGSLALGAGITLGTAADNGFTLSGKMLLIIVFPGPILLIEGKANLLRERASLDEEPLFRALAVLDGREGSFLLGLDAQYEFGAGGELIDIHAGAEAFFSLSDGDAWHLYIGEREPRERRIRASICFHIFEANAYFMLDAHQLAMGAWIGYAADWRFGPLRAILEAWIEGNVIVSWKPVHLHGDFWLHGKVDLSVFWFDFGLGIDGRLEADIFDPFHLLAELSVGIYLPWPLPDIEMTITLEWGPEPIPPHLPLPLKEIAVEHLKVTTSWLLAKGSLLLPDYDADGDGFLDGPAGPHQPQLDTVPVVPVDCRPHITFGRAVHDAAGVGGNPQPTVPAWERVGDPGKNEGPVEVKYSLIEVELQKLDGNAWTSVARKAATRNAPGVSDLFGSWAPMPAMPDGGGTAVNQTKLWLWSKTPFDYTRHGGRGWDEWFTERFDDYPCVPPASGREICCDFRYVDLASTFTPPWAHPIEPGFTFAWTSPATQAITVLGAPVRRLDQALCFPNVFNVFLENVIAQPNEIIIDLPEPARAVRIVVVDQEGVSVTGFDAQGMAFGPVRGGVPANPHVEVLGQDLVRVVLVGNAQPCILEVCAIIAPDPAEVARREEMAQHLVDEMARWSREDAVLEPYSTYRLMVKTKIEARSEKGLDGYTKQGTYYRIVPDPEQVAYAYFRTEGPPGFAQLSPPANAPAGDNFASGLEDLGLYVRQTVPASVPAAGEKSPLPRPVYRAYDVGVEFNENYVDIMYRLSGRDLGLYLYDNNNRPARDADGRLIVADNRWGAIESVILTESEARFVTVVNASDCAAVPVFTIARNKTLTSSAEGRVLDADTVYEGRLVPLLTHVDFSDPALPGWQLPAVDEGTEDGPSVWAATGHATLRGGAATAAAAVVSLDGAPSLSSLDPDFDVLVLASDSARPPHLYRILSVDDTAKTVTVDGEPNLAAGTSAWEIPRVGAVEQTSGIWGGTSDAADSVKPGTMLSYAGNVSLPDTHPERAIQWSDYRLSVLVRARGAADGAFGVVFRYFDPEDAYYRISMDRALGYRRLVRVVAGTHTVLAEDDFVYQPDSDYLVTVEAIGSSLRVHQDGALVFDVTDDAIPRGRFGLYAWRNAGIRFSDVRVDDFRNEAPVVYRFKFTTSRFADFFHHLHSFLDETWAAALPVAALSNADLAALTARTASLDDPVSDDESRAFEALAAAISGPGAPDPPPEVQVTKVVREDATVALLVKSPEPIDWSRTSVEVGRTARRSIGVNPPQAIKLTDVALGATRPNGEYVTALLLEATNPTHHRLEHRRLPGPLAEPAGASTIFLDEFEGADRGLLFREEFGPNALDHYERVDEGTSRGPSAWGVSGGHLVQTGDYFAGSIWWNVPDKPGTLLITGSPSWDNVRIRVTLRSEANATIGLVFRYLDGDTYYRFSMYRYRPRGPIGTRQPEFQRSYRRLVKRVGGTVTVLWEDEGAFTPGHSYRLVIEAVGSMLLGYLDDVLLFSVLDSDVDAGRVGFYSWNNPGAHFEALEIESLETPPVLWQPSFNDLGELEVIDEAGAIQGPSEWAASRGALTQSSNVHVVDITPHRPGTYAVGGRAAWRDVEISARLRSDDAAAIA